MSAQKGCIPVPRVPAPTLPSPFTIPIFTLPTIPDIDATLCCHLYIPIPIPPISLALIITLPLVETLNGYIDLLADYVNTQLADFENKLQCPFE